MKILKIKQSASNEIAMGKVFVVKKEEITAAVYKISTVEIEKKLTLYEKASKKVVKELSELAKTSEIFAAHVELVQDITLVQMIKEMIQNHMTNCLS